MGLRNDTFPAYLEAIACCMTSTSMTTKQMYALMVAVSDLPKRFEDTAEGVLRFMTKFSSVEPCTVISFVVRWAEKLLVCEDSDSEEAALRWLKTYLFRHTTLSSMSGTEGYRLDVQRTTTITALAGVLMGILRDAQEKKFDSEDYERAIDALTACMAWLGDFTKTVNDHKSDTSGVGTRVIEEGTNTSTSITAASTVEMEELAVDASEVLEQCADTIMSLADWSQGADNEHYGWQTTTRSAESSEGSTDPDSDSGSEGWEDEGGEADQT